jgi:hypothetical protein
MFTRTLNRTWPNVLLVSSAENLGTCSVTWQPPSGLYKRRRTTTSEALHSISFWTTSSHLHFPKDIFIIFMLLLFLRLILSLQNWRYIRVFLPEFCRHSMPLLHSNSWLVTFPLKVIDHVLNPHKLCGIGLFIVLFNLKFSVLGAERMIIFLKRKILIISRASFPPNFFMKLKYCKFFLSKFSMFCWRKKSLRVFLHPIWLLCSHQEFYHVQVI